MIKKLSFILLASLLFFSCELDKDEKESFTNYTTKGPEVGTLYGKVYNGLTRTALTKTSENSLAGKLTVAKSGSIKTINASFNSNGYYYFEDVPLDSEYVVEFSDGTTYTDFIASSFISSTGIQSNDTVVFSKYNSDLRNIYLFPANVNPGALTIEIYDGDNGLISSSGTVLLCPVSNSALNNGTVDILTNEISLATKVSGTLASGTVTIPAASLVLGVTYIIEVYGVTGYDVDTSSIITMESASATTKRVTLTDTESFSNPRIVSRSDFDSYGKQIASNGSITLTFDRDIELDPNSQYLAEISSYSQNDTDDDGTTSVLAAFTGDAGVATPVASNHLTLTASGKTLTIAVKSGYLSTEDTDDELSIVIDTSTIAVREASSSRPFTALNSISAVNASNTGTVIVRYISVLE